MWFAEKPAPSLWKLYRHREKGKKSSVQVIDDTETIWGPVEVDGQQKSVNYSDVENVDKYAIGSV